MNILTLAIVFISLFSTACQAIAEDANAKQPTGLELVKVKGGCFKQGSDIGGFMERPQHEVCVSDYYIGKYEVTQRDWRDVMGNNPSRFSNCGMNCPVDSVSWSDANEFIRRLNSITGRQFRLPTEAEWEFACRDRGESQLYCGSSDINSVAWYDLNSSFKPHSVGQKKPNLLGIYDMSGNVWEWTYDWSGVYPPDRLVNPKGASSGSNRVRRGGSWQYPTEKAHATWRSNGYQDDRAMDIGFRLAHPSN